MAKDKSETGTKGASKKGGDTEPLASVASANSGVPLHSFEASRGPIESKATEPKEAFGIADAETEEKTGKPVRIKSRVQRYTAFGQTFRNDDAGALYYQGDFTDDQWKALRANPNVVISKAPVNEE